MAGVEIGVIAIIIVFAALALPILFNENPAAFLENGLCTIFTPGNGQNTTCNSIKGNVTFIADNPLTIVADNSANTITWGIGAGNGTSHTNIGGGAEVFKNETAGINSNWRTIVGGGGVSVVQNDETISIQTGGGGGPPALQAISRGTPGNVIYNATTDGNLITVIGDGITITNASSLVFSLNATIGRLNDVNTTDLDENQFLIFNITSENFENKPISALLRLKDTYFNAEEATVDDLTGIDCVNDVTFSLFENSNINQYRRQAIEFCPDAEDDDNFTWLYVVPKILTGTPEFNFKIFWSDDDTDADSFMKRVDEDDDDCEESIGPLALGDVTCSSSDLEIHSENIVETPADDHDLVGMRWTNVTIPFGVTILNATIQFHVDSINPDDPIIVRLKGHDVDDAPAFDDTSDFDISSRTNTTAFVDWNIPDWVDTSDEGPAQETPNLASIVQEIIDRPGWASGNAMVIKTTEWIGCTITACPVNFGQRHAESHDGESSSAPQLKVFWSVGGGGNPDPVCFEFSLLRLTNTQDLNGDFTQRMTVCENRSGSDNLSITQFDIDNHDLEPEDLVFFRIHRPNDFVANDFESNVFVFGGELQWLD